MRKLATIQKIAEIQPIKNADAIEKVRINEWWCVAKKGEFVEGDICVYFEIDSLLPLDDPAFEFLGKGTKPKNVDIDGKTYTGYRLKTIRLRGQISQGLALPLHVFEDKFLGQFNDREFPSVGTDVSEKLGVVKYEIPLPACLSGKIKGHFPGDVPKTDEERIQNIYDDIKKSDVDVFYVTEKLDGTSATYLKMPNKDNPIEDEFSVCSRNWMLEEDDDNTYWRVAKEYDIENKVPVGYAVQGEIVGPGIQKNPLKLSKVSFYVYSVYDIYAGRYLNFDELRQFCVSNKFEMVPIVAIRFEMNSIATIDFLLEMANSKSLLSPECDIEGLVFRPYVESRLITEDKDMRYSFKVISNDYLLRHNI